MDNTDYMLSHSAEEVDELLTKVKNSVCLPYVELTTMLVDDDEVTLTEEENEKLTAAIGAPCIIACKVPYEESFMLYKGIFDFIDDGHEIYFFTSQNEFGSIIMMSLNGEWTLQYSSQM